MRLLDRFMDWTMDMRSPWGFIVFLGSMVGAVLLLCCILFLVLYSTGNLKQPYCRPGEALVWMQHVRQGKTWVYKDPWCIKPQGYEAPYK